MTGWGKEETEEMWTQEEGRGDRGIVSLIFEEKKARWDADLKDNILTQKILTVWGAPHSRGQFEPVGPAQ